MENYHSAESSAFKTSDKFSSLNLEASSTALEDAYASDKLFTSTNMNGKDTASDIFGRLELYEGSESEIDSKKSAKKQKEVKKEGSEKSKQKKDSYDDDQTELDRMLREDGPKPQKKPNN